MKKKLIFGLLILALVALPLFAACGEEEVTPPPTTPPTTPTAEANWWDALGEPQYGGTINVAISAFATNFDTYMFPGAECDLQYETLFEPDWALDRQTWDMTGMFTPDQYWTGNLAENWDIVDPQTITVYIRHGVLWQNIPPVNGREFTAYDVQAHYDRAMGRGSYTEGSPMFAGIFASWESVTATDDYTVVFKFKQAGGQWLQTISDRAAYNLIEAPEWVAQGDLQNWQGVIGTGPWMLTNFVEGNSLTFSKNPTYWGTDQRHPENQVPYADTLQLLIIPDASTRIAALRSGQVDVLGSGGTALTWQQAQTLADTNPDIMQQKVAAGSSGISFRLDMEPFTDIRVRQALNMALDREAIAEGYYGGTGEAVPSGLVTRAYQGYAYAYEDWPQELKDAYAFNVEGAKALLAQTDWPTGFDTNVIASNAGDLQLLQVFQSYFADIGVNMEIKPYDFATYESMRRTSQHDQMVTAGGAFTWPPSRFISQYYSQGPDNGDTKVNDPGYDALYDQFWAALTADEGAQAVQAADKYVVEHFWLVAAGESYTFNVWQPYLKGYSGETLFWGAGITLARLWID